MSMETNPSSPNLPFSNSNEITQDSINPSSPHHPQPNNSTLHSSSSNNNNSKTSAQSLFKLLSSDLKYIEETCNKLKEYREHVGNEFIKNVSAKLENLKLTFNLVIENPTLADEEIEAEIQRIEAEIRKFKKSLRKLKMPIPSKFKINYEELDKDPNLQSNSSVQGKPGDPMMVIEQTRIMPNLYNNSRFMHSLAYRDFDLLYQGLDRKEKLSLLCFSIFPRGAIIKKRLMVYWWMSEGFIAEENLGGVVFKKFVDKALIMPVNEKRRPFEQVGSCKMHPFVRSAVIMFAKRANFFDFDANGNPSEDYTSTFRSCLTGKGLSNFKKLESLHMLFNVDEAILEFRLEWLMNMKNVNILYLGRWKASGKHHIEVEDTKFLQGLKYMKCLKFLSLQGISRIIELPGSISKLKSLTILDLRACHNLEVLPDEIGLLPSLTHLDMSECYLLEHMPRQLSLLKKLLVLKGFVVSDTKDRSACTLDQLSRLENLKKLSIYTAMKEFPDTSHLNAFTKFKNLTKLTIAWGGGSKSARAAEAKSVGAKTEEPKTEKKLGTQTQEPKPAAQNQETKTETETKPGTVKNQEPDQETGGNSKTREANSTAEINSDQEAGGNNTRDQEPGIETKPAARKNNQEMGGDSKTREENLTAEINSDQEAGGNNTRNQEPGIETKPAAGKNNQEMGGDSKTHEENLTPEINSDQDAGGNNTRNQEPGIETKPAAGKNNQEMGGDSKTREENLTPEINSDQEGGGNNTRNQEPKPEVKPDASKNQEPNQEAGGNSRSREVNSTAENNANQETRGKSTSNSSVYKGVSRSVTLKQDKEEPGLPRKLVKLDLQCFSGKLAPKWLKPGDLESLKKLYIRGGELHFLRRWQPEETWNVETLRLKYLSDFEMGWIELLSLFPKLIYLEKVKCPKLTLFPCDAFGVWINKMKNQKN
ncbi:hypothetical protein LguiB_004422 [Lonicera macranthoides]